MKKRLGITTMAVVTTLFATLLMGCGNSSESTMATVGMHVAPKHTVKLCQRGNGIDIQGIEPSFLHGAEVLLNFAFVT